MMKTIYRKSFLCSLLLFTAVSCSEAAPYLLSPVAGEEKDTSEKTETAVISDRRAMTASYNTKFQSDKVKAIERKGVLVSWRFLDTDPDDIAFDIYRSTDGGNFEKLNNNPIANSSNYKDLTADVTVNNEYKVCKTGSTETLCSYTFTPAMAQNFYRTIKLNTNVPDPSLVYQANDAAVGDLDGDGEYEIVLKRSVVNHDNTAKTVDPGSCLLEAYKLNGAFLWRIDLGINIRQGPHYTPFIVYDLNGDGRAEVAVRTSEGTTFGDGTTIGDTNGDKRIDYRNKTNGRVLEGPEFLSVIDGSTGTELARTDYIPRGEEDTWMSYWGDNWGNRIDRFLMAVGHFGSMDGQASIVISRGYYQNWQMAAYDLSGNELRKRWHFNTYPDNQQYKGEGNHNLAVGDVDNDGKDEIIFGSCCIDHNGTGLYATGLGHGDALHLGKFDPTREGLQVVACKEECKRNGNVGLEFRDAGTGQLIWSLQGSGGDVGRCMVADIDPDSPGCEVWASYPKNQIFSCKGELLNRSQPSGKGGGQSYNMGIWWSGSLNRQVLDGVLINGRAGELETRLFTGSNFGVKSINSSKANPCFYGDIWGDWREEIIYASSDNTELRIFTTDFETEHRFRPLMNDHIYKMSATLQNIGYNQPTHTGFYLGSDLQKKTK